jgi:hypothetical protein
VAEEDVEGNLSNSQVSGRLGRLWRVFGIKANLLLKITLRTMRLKP